ncbi:MAG TPA: Cof-type HAD-IIB family hydrolase [Acidisarcina sp.]|nr:Cof-type HAD-IIB family hydrolase [Acidisarcina sp.]
MTSASLAAPVKMIAIDIDGTILPSRGTAISERNQRALRAAEAAGIEIVIATGRRQAFALPIVEPVGLSQETILISSNGSITRNFAGDLLERSLVPSATARELCRMLRNYGSTVMTFDREGPGSLVIESLQTLHERIALWVEANRSSLAEVVPLERALDDGESPVQAMVCGTVEAMREAYDALASSAMAQEIALHRTEYPRRNLCIVDILPQGCSKGAALERLARQRGIGREQVMAIGDNYNDVEMMAFAGRGVLMGNATPELQQIGQEHGWLITGTNDEDGVAQVIESVCLDSETVGQADRA